ncbi:MAG: response regulator, partial [Leptolyngbyaceae cyanobacterium SL_7_1]|nr:response regulator [Leptolyngbyaceae cyanobacterium SL_7_1]
KLKTAGIKPEVIETLYGLGYRLGAEPSKTADQPSLDTPASVPVIPSRSSARRQLDVDGLVVVERFRSTLTQRLQTLNNALRSLQDEQLTAIDRQHAISEAHRLSGSLGTFGYAAGSEVAQAIEYWLNHQTTADGTILNGNSTTTDPTESFSTLLTQLQQIVAQPPTLPNILAPDTESLESKDLPNGNARVLIVDDDPIALAALATLLQPWGLQVTCLTNPDRFWETFTTIQPDLLLLDLEMPTVNGIDLCREIRQDMDHGDLPIVVVTAHTDPAAVARIFDAGADDMVSKPILGPELVSRVMIYTERAHLRRQVRNLHQQQTRQWQHQLFLHTLTQIGVWDFFWECLQREWYFSQQKKTPLSLMFCGIDDYAEFSKAFDRQQSPTDSLHWQTIGSALQDCLKSSDVVAQYKEGKFAILLPNTALRDTLPIAERMQQRSPICEFFIKVLHQTPVLR